jgi:hypothetical protein
MLTQRLGRPENRWKDDIIDDMKKLKMKNLTSCIQNPNKWKMYAEKKKKKKKKEEEEKEEKVFIWAVSPSTCIYRCPKHQKHITIILLVCDPCHDKIIMLCLKALHSTTIHPRFTHIQFNCTLWTLCTTATHLKRVCKMDPFNNFVSFHASLVNKWAVNKLFTDFKEAYNSVRRAVLYRILTEFGILMKLIMKVTNQVQLYRLIYYSQSPLHVSGHVFAHHQENLTVFTAFGSIHPSCCQLVSWMS